MANNTNKFIHVSVYMQLSILYHMRNRRVMKYIDVMALGSVRFNRAVEVPIAL